MRIKNGDAPAMPLLLDTKVTASGGSVADDYFEGLTKREMIAMAAMQGILSSLTEEDWLSANELARCAVRNADALLAELERTK